MALRGREPLLVGVNAGVVNDRVHSAQVVDLIGQLADLLLVGQVSDNKIRAFDKTSGALLWEGQLPAAGNTTPATYMVNGRQYIVIAAGGGKNDAPSGGTYVAFALPR